MATPSSNLPLLGAPGSFSELEESFAALQTWLGRLNSNFAALSAQVAGGGQAIFSAARADVPTTLGTADEGTVYYVTDFAHLVRWSGTAWAFMDGGNDFFADHRAAPGTGWALCNGATVTRMTIGVTLGTTTFATPNLSGSAAYKKSGAAYAGIAAASGATATGGVDHTHGVSGDTGVEVAAWLIDTGSTHNVANASHTHPFNVTSGGASVVDHTHGVGSLDMAHLTVLPYYRL